MTRALLLLLFAVLAALPAGAATITSATCTSTVTTGCVKITLPSPEATSSVTVQVTGTWVATLVFEGSLDGTTYRPLMGVPSGGGAYVSSVTANDLWQVHTAGATYLRVRASAYTSGTATVVLSPSSAPPFTDVVRPVGSDGGTASVSIAGPVTVTSDGGMGVVLRGPMETTQDGGTALAVFAPDVVRVVGPTFGSVIVSGTVSLSTSSLSTLAPQQQCSISEARRGPISTTPAVFPPNLADGGTGAMEGRTSWAGQNVDPVKDIVCRVDPGDGGVPDCATSGFGTTLLRNGGRLIVPVRQFDTVRCVACSNGAVLEYVEEACVQL